MKWKKFYDKKIQKVLAVISLFCLFFTFGTTTASAAGTAKVTVSSCTVERGASASVSFNLEGNPGIWGLKLRISYDHSALTLKSVAAGTVFESGELTLSENLNKDPYVVVASGNSLENKTANGTIVTLNFTVNSDAAFKAYPVTVEVSQANNVAGDKVSINSADGSVSVVNCVHANKTWRVTKAAKCEENGVETQTCTKCGETFGTRAIKATGHQHTELKNAKAATKTAAGYTGDTYCKDCGKLISKGKSIAKLADDTPAVAPATTKASATGMSTTKPSATKPSTTKSSGTTATTAATNSKEPVITSGTDLVYEKNSTEPLVFVSDADFSEFVRVEIDGETLDEKDYSAESGSTIITVNADCLNKLSSGEHTISIVSKNGTASAQFTVQEETEKSTTATTKPSESETTTIEKQSSSRTIGIVIMVVILVGGAAAFYIIWRRRG